MLFISCTYALFLCIVFALYWVLDYMLRNHRLPLVQNIFLLLASYIFYAWWDWRFLGLLAGMSLMSYLAGLLLYNIDNQVVRKWIAGVVTAVDLGILGLFKYYSFFISSLSGFLNIDLSQSSLHLILPLGISFFTFQAVSYIIDAYHRKLPEQTEKSAESLVECLLYIGFFPKLLAGPIERPSHFLPQLAEKRQFSYQQGLDGLRQILWGLFKKVVVADQCAVYVNYVYSDYSSQNSLTLLLAAIFYTIQIYGDFSGYSDMAIGSARLLGFSLADNFRLPYFSRNMGEFWKRWHISLNTWFVDYVYIPLGGSRNGKAKTVANTMIVFLLSGLWHGADWSFVLWGAYHGLLVVLLILFNRNIKYKEVVATHTILPSLKELCQMSLVFILAAFGWMMFRADNISVFADYTVHIFSNDFSLMAMPYIKNRFFFVSLLLFMLIMLVIEWKQRREMTILNGKLIHNRILRNMFYLFLIFLIVIYQPAETTFVYFQF